MKYNLGQKRKRKKLYQRLATGIHYHRFARFRFLTLTSSPSSPDLQVSFTELKRRMRRKFKKFEYFAVYTNEGHGVIHIIFVGKYMPQEWIKENWIEIHGAQSVDIRDVGDIYNASGLAGYFLSQYLANQDAIRWISQSRYWVYPGYQKDWVRLKKISQTKKWDFEKLLLEWHKHLDKRYQQHLL